jgi:molybdopterin-containing oxidoreductase family membrane subunit
MWVSVALAVISLFIPSSRAAQNESVSSWALAVVGSLWIDKGLGMVITGFVPNSFGHITEYWPTTKETLIVIGIYALGALIVTVFYKIAIEVREELQS